MVQGEGGVHLRYGIAAFLAFLVYDIVGEVSNGFWGAVAAGIVVFLALKGIASFMRGPRPEPSS